MTKPAEHKVYYWVDTGEEYKSVNTLAAAHSLARKIGDQAEFYRRYYTRNKRGASFFGKDYERYWVYTEFPKLTWQQKRLWWLYHRKGRRLRNG